MSSYDEEPPAPRDDPYAYGYPSPAATCAPDVSPMFRNLDTSAQVPSFRNSDPDREAARRHSRYASHVWPRLQHEAKVRWFALFGITYPLKEV